MKAEEIALKHAETEAQRRRGYGLDMEEKQAVRVGVQALREKGMLVEWCTDLENAPTKTRHALKLSGKGDMENRTEFHKEASDLVSNHGELSSLTRKSWWSPIPCPNGELSSLTRATTDVTQRLESVTAETTPEELAELGAEVLTVVRQQKHSTFEVMPGMRFVCRDGDGHHHVPNPLTSIDAIAALELEYHRRPVCIDFGITKIVAVLWEKGAAHGRERAHSEPIARTIALLKAMEAQDD